MLKRLGLNLWRRELKLSHCQSPGPSATTSFSIAPPMATVLWRQVGVPLRARPRLETSFPPTRGPRRLPERMAESPQAYLTAPERTSRTERIPPTSPNHIPLAHAHTPPTTLPWTRPVPLGMWPREATGVAARPPPFLELTALRTQRMGLQPEEFPARRQRRTILQLGAPQADCSAPTAMQRPVNSLDTPVTPRTFVSHPPPSRTVADVTSLQLEILTRNEPSARGSKAYPVITEVTSLQLEIQVLTSLERR